MKQAILSAKEIAGEPAAETVCFLVHEPYTARDISTAEQYGIVKILLDRTDSPSLMPGPCLEKMRSRLAEFEYDPNHDYVFFAGGDAMAMFLAGMVLADLGVTRTRYLRWERDRDPTTGGRMMSGRYVPGVFNNGTR